MVVFLKSINSMYRKTRRLQKFLAGAIAKAKRKAIENGLEPTMIAQSEINTPVSPSGGRKKTKRLSIWKWCQTKLNIA